VLLQQPEAAGVDGAGEQPAEQVDCTGAEPLGYPLGDALLQLGGCLLGEREGDDAPARLPVGQQLGHRCDTTRRKRAKRAMNSERSTIVRISRLIPCIERMFVLTSRYGAAGNTDPR
jgi:hypothetical protein